MGSPVASTVVPVVRNTPTFLCKRKGLKITLTVGTRKGDGLMRRLAVSKDPVVMLNAALQEAAKAAGVELKISEDGIHLDG